MAWRIPKIHSSCCGCSLMTGSKIIGYFHMLVYAGVIIIGILVAIFEPGKISKIYLSYHNLFILENIFLILMEFSLVSQATFSFFLLYGLYKENYIFVLPWVLLKIIDFISSVISLILLLFMHLFGLYYGDAAIEFVALVLEAYFIFVVYNCYRTMKEERDFPTRSAVLPF